ncbi:MAG: helix-turn-helix domain-containing protein [Bacteroidota bacterium]
MTENSIAVLPFVNLSADAENEYFSDGLTEEIINALAKIDSLKVTSRTSAFFFKGKDIQITEISKQLNVATLLEGSVRLSGKAVRIAAQLIQAEGDFHLWSETWDRQLDDIFAVQDDISLLIAEKLREHVGHFEINEHLVNTQTKDLDAYTLFLKGRYYFNRWNPEDVQQAIEYYQQALTIDPKHANSLVGLADSYSFLATCGFISYQEGWGKCAQLTQQALEIDNRLPAAYYQLANLAFFTEGDFSKALSLVECALDINPNHVESLQLICLLCLYADKEDTARQHLDAVRSVDPMSAETQFYRGYFYYMQRDFDQAIVQLDACLDQNPKSIPSHTIKAACLLMLARFDQVITYYDSLPLEIVIPAEKIGSELLAFVLKSDQKQADEYLAKLQRAINSEDGFTADVYLFLYYCQTSQVDAAFRWIEQATENRSPLLLIRYADPLVDSLRSDARYTTFQQKLFPPEAFNSSNTSRKKKSLLDEKSLTNYRKRLLSHIESEKPYLDSDLSLRSLANQIDIHPNQLSWLLNESLGSNFNEFINHYRVETFKKLAKDPDNAHVTILGLAYDSGFNSKTVFNTYFKKEVGMTPKQFLKA